ncbi:beta-lactamase/transpeptidase-like protein, partial [Cryphonectria parasitica EP155]
QPCPLYGQDLPAPTSLSTSNVFQAATSSLNSQLAGTLNGTSNATSLFGTLDTEATAFSVEFFSLSEDDPLFTYHYTPSLFSQNNTGVAWVNSDSVYRIGSVSKLWTVYLYLITAGDGSWNDPITKYVPELEAIAKTQKSDPVNNVNWNSITIGALASQLAGIGRDAVYSPQLASTLELLGIPNQGGNNHSTCGSLSLDIMTPCNRSQFFTDYPTQHPVVSAFQTPIYSNAAYQILSYAIENITGQTMEAIFDQHLVADLNLTSTSYAAPNTTTNAVIPPFDTTISWFSADLHDETPAGGYYSSINDIRAISKAMLSSAQLDPAVTRRWMKPHSLLSNPDAMVGAPWELQRAPGSPYLMMMTKSGDVGIYASYVVLVPELEVGFTVLTAGAGYQANVEILADVLAAVLVPAARAAARDEAKAKYEGVY